MNLLLQSITNVNRRILGYIVGGYFATVIVIAVICAEVLALIYLAGMAPELWSIEPGLVPLVIVMPGLVIVITQIHYILTVRDELITLQARATEAIACDPDMG